MDHLCYICLVFAMLLCLFVAALWSPEGKGLTYWLLLVIFIVIFGILEQVWYLILSIPDPCCLSYCVGLCFSMHYFMSFLALQSS